MAHAPKVPRSLRAVTLAVVGVLSAIYLADYAGRASVTGLPDLANSPESPPVDSRGASAPSHPDSKAAAAAHAATLGLNRGTPPEFQTGQVAGHDAGATMTLSEVWSADGTWQGVASDPLTGDIYALNSWGDLAQFDPCGKEVGRVRLDIPVQTHPSTFPSVPPRTLRLANLAGDAGPEFIVCFNMGVYIGAFDATGKRLWTYCTAEASAALDVWPARVLRDPNTAYEPVVIGFIDGVHLLNSDGTVRWVNNKVGNIWHVCADLTGAKGEAEIMATSAGGQVLLLSRDGRKMRFLRTLGYSAMVRASKLEHAARPVLITDDYTNKQIVAMTPSGKVLWRTPSPDGADGKVWDGVAAENRPWFAGNFLAAPPPTAVASAAIAPVVRRRIVAVYDVTTGVRLTETMLDAKQIAWASAPNRPPLLLIAGGPLRAFELQASAPRSSTLPAKQP